MLTLAVSSELLKLKPYLNIQTLFFGFNSLHGFSLSNKSSSNVCEFLKEISCKFLIKYLFIFKISLKVKFLIKN